MRARPNVGVMDEAGMARALTRTSPALLLERAHTTPSEIAFRDKHLGVYRGYDWREYAALVESVTLGLLGPWACGR